MKKLIIFLITISLAFIVARTLNEVLELKTSGSSLQAFKENRLRGIRANKPSPTNAYDVLVFGDSLLEILFEPVEFDSQSITSSRPTLSTNLAVRSLTTDDFSKLVSIFKSPQHYDSCVIQVPALHFPKRSREELFLKFWPGRGLSDYLNLWNPLSRMDHGFDSPANLWTGVISQETNPWNVERRGGLDLEHSPHLIPLRKALKSTFARAKLNKAYDQVMGLSRYKFDKNDVEEFAKNIEALKEICNKRVVVWPIFSPELQDRRFGPDPAELQKLRGFFAKKIDVPILDMPWNPETVPFLDSQHLDPSFREEFHKWLAEII